VKLLMISGDASVVEGYKGAFYQMLRRFSTHWERIDIICPHPSRVECLAVHGNVYFHPASVPRWLQPWFIARRGRTLLEMHAHDLITSHDFGFFYNGIGAWLLARRRNIPLVSEIHHVEGYPLAVTLRERLYRWLAMIYLRLVWRHAAAIRVVNRKEVPGLLRELGVPEEKILILPSLYLDYEVFRPAAEVQRRYDLLFVGRLVPNKGISTIVEALAEVHRTHPGTTLLILGRGPLRSALEAQARRLGVMDAITFVERVDSPHGVARVYNEARMLICASSVEGGPRVTVEAMACGTPVISTPVGVMPDILVDGVTGLEFHWDARELAQKVRLLLDNETLRADIGEAGREAVQGFEAEAMIARYAEGLQAVARRWQEARP